MSSLLPLSFHGISSSLLVPPTLVLKAVRRSEHEMPTSSKHVVQEVGGNEMEMSVGLGFIPDKVNESKVYVRFGHVAEEVEGCN
ncbi:hypothetical protein V6N11_022334 [Hibiscus sabdariffa]|uniref:Uncharacterized protein n=1 Tax=Hibiscus sabdariffa TaxID=183260 RepID=A0ABR2TIV6_9ROSI